MELHVLYPICVHSMVLMRRVDFKIYCKSKSFRLHLYGGTILDFLGQSSTKLLKVKLKPMFVL